MDARYSKLIRNTGLLSIGSFGSSLLSFLLLPLYTSILSTTDYGISDLITTTTSLLFPILILTISESVLRFSLDENIEKRQVFSIGLQITIIGQVVMIVLLPVIFLTPLKCYWPYYLAYFSAISIYATVSQFVKGLNEVRVYAIGGIINTLITILCNIFLLVIFKMGIKGYLIAIISGPAVSILYYLKSARLLQYILPFKDIDIGIRKSMLTYSIPLIPNGISWWISNSSDRYFLTAFCGLSANGIYSISYRIPSILTILTGLFISAWQLSAVDDFNSEKSRYFFSNVANKYWTVVIFLSTWLITIVRPLASILFVNDFYDAWHYSPFLVLSAMCNTFACFYGTIYTSAKQTKMLLYSTLIAALINIALNFFLIPSMGIYGAAIATLISYLSILIVRAIDSRRIMLICIEKKLIYCLIISFVQLFSLFFDNYLYWVVTCICSVLISFIIRKSLFRLCSSVIGNR